MLGASLATSPAGLNASKLTYGAAGKRLWCRLRAHAGYALCLISVLLSDVQGETFWRQLSQRSTAGEGPGEHSRGMGSGKIQQCSAAEVLSCRLVRSLREGGVAHWLRYRRTVISHASRLPVLFCWEPGSVPKMPICIQPQVGWSRHDLQP